MQMCQSRRDDLFYRPHGKSESCSSVGATPLPRRFARERSLLWSYERFAAPVAIDK